MAYDPELVLPYDVPANEFLNLEGRQFSTSRNWAVWLPDYLSRYAPDPLRYYVAAIAPETRDSEFTWAGYVERNNNELVAAWGNLVNRVVSFAHRHWAASSRPPASWESATASCWPRSRPASPPSATTSAASNCAKVCASRWRWPAR